MNEEAARPHPLHSFNPLTIRFNRSDTTVRGSLTPTTQQRGKAGGERSGWRACIVLLSHTCPSEKLTHSAPEEEGDGSVFWSAHAPSPSCPSLTKHNTHAYAVSAHAIGMLCLWQRAAPPQHSSNPHTYFDTSHNSTRLPPSSIGTPLKLFLLLINI